MAKPSVKRENLKTEIDKNKVLELFVCEYSSEKIAKQLECSIDYVETILANSLSQFYKRNQEYAERASLMHLAKTRALTAKWMPIALDGSLQAAQFVLKVINTEQDIIQNGLKAGSDNAADVNDVQNYEQTLTSVDPRYAIALENLTEEWLNTEYLNVQQMEALVPAVQENATQALAALHEKHHNLEESLLIAELKEAENEM